MINAQLAYISASCLLSANQNHIVLYACRHSSIGTGICMPAWLIYNHLLHPTKTSLEPLLDKDKCLKNNVCTISNAKTHY